jgi:type III secretion system YscJ/HrcJ family lipoprotein
LRSELTLNSTRSRASALAAATLLLVLTASGCSVPIAVGLDDTVANQALVALEKNGMAAEKERDPDAEGRWRLSVARDDASSAVGILAQESLPPVQTPGVLESLGQGSVVPSRLSEHAKLVAGMGGELERSLRGLDGVVSVRVHLAVPAKDALALDERQVEPSASVLLRHRGATPPIAAAEIQRLVAGAVPSLTADHVSVVMLPAPALRQLPEHELARFGPLTVTRASVLALRAIVGGALCLNLLLLAGLVALWARLKRADTALSEAKGAEQSAQGAE